MSSRQLNQRQLPRQALSTLRRLGWCRAQVIRGGITHTMAGDGGIRAMGGIAAGNGR